MTVLTLYHNQLFVAHSQSTPPQVIPGVAIAFMTYELAKKTLGVTTNATQR